MHGYIHAVSELFQLRMPMSLSIFLKQTSEDEMARICLQKCFQFIVTSLYIFNRIYSIDHWSN
jgi:hypothetical protein